MTETKPDDDPAAWFAAQLAASADEGSITDSSQPVTPESEALGSGNTPVAAPRPSQTGIDRNLPLRRPVLPSANSFTWGLSPSGAGGAHPDGDANTGEDGVAAATAAPIPDTSTPAAPVRPFFPAPVAAPPALSESPDSRAAQVASVPPVSAARPVYPVYPVPPVSAPGDVSGAATSPDIAALTAAIPTIQEVLDSPSPRRAAREAAAREAALREASERGASIQPQPQPQSKLQPEDARAPQLDSQPESTHEPVSAFDGASREASGVASDGSATESPAPAAAFPTMADIAARRAAILRSAKPLSTPPLAATELTSDSPREEPPLAAAASLGQSFFSPSTPLFLSDAAVPPERVGADAITAIPAPLASNAGGTLGVIPNQDETKPARNQRLIVIVLIGLVVVLIGVVAFNLLQ